MTKEKKPRHVDEFIWEVCPPKPDGSDWARWMLMHFRMPAYAQMRFAIFINERKLFATWKEKRYRVTGASRLGDVWLAEDFKRDTGYDHRVNVDELSNWGESP